jgi:hypothetical protein
VLFRVLVIIVGTVLVTGCVAAQPPPSTAPTLTPPSTQPPRVDTTSTTSPATTTARTPSTTFPIEIERFAEANNVTPEQAQDLLQAQQDQAQLVQRLVGLVGEDLVVDWGFFDGVLHSDRVTIRVIDERAVEVVSNRVAEVGLDPAKTRVIVAPEDSDREWLRNEPYDHFQWLYPPGPHLYGAWRLIAIDGEAVEANLEVGFGIVRWHVEECLAGSFTTSSVDYSLDITLDASSCDDSVRRQLKDLLGKTIAANDGHFRISDEGGRAIWVGQAGSLTWAHISESGTGRVLDTPVVLDPSSDAYREWMASPGPKMEGAWDLVGAGGEDPATDVTLLVNSDLWAIEGLCNTTAGRYAISTEGRLAFNGGRTLVDCGDSPSMVAEEQVFAIFGHPELFGVGFDQNRMTWSGSHGDLVWQRRGG